MAGLVSDWRKPAAKDPDRWLDQAPDFSRPICAHLRDWIFRWEPDLEPSVKWNSLCFKARKLVVGLGAFKHHAGVVFFRGTELADEAGLFNQGEDNASIRTIRLTTLENFNHKALKRLLHLAVELDYEPKMPGPPKVKRPQLPMPNFFAAALKNNPVAAANFEKMSASCQREYLAWLGFAKREETKAQRLEQTIAALKSGHRWADRKLASPVTKSTSSPA
ncbi:hypothetical protein BH09VER1_BH09VER1_28950 [soil metagenome]